MHTWREERNNAEARETPSIKSFKYVIKSFGSSHRLSSYQNQTTPPPHSRLSTLFFLYAVTIFLFVPSPSWPLVEAEQLIVIPLLALDDGDQDEGDVSGSEGTLVEIEFIDSGVEGDESRDKESEEDEVNYVSHESYEEELKVRDHVKGESSGEWVSIDDHVVGDLSEEDVKDISEKEKIIGTPLEVAPIEHEHEPIVKKLIDVPTKFVGDASYGLNLLHEDMKIKLIRAQDLVEKNGQSRKVLANFMEQFDALLRKYEEQLGQKETRKK
ncbi:hypothetical protein Syun_014757 [Stephania yunnanensis]|uniref:Uncharacterized protein n=1 Tax=Stephania yunnanensis TaxID=152371 RepID=A0AAP0P933_9MAGN